MKWCHEDAKTRPVCLSVYLHVVQAWNRGSVYIKEANAYIKKSETDRVTGAGRTAACSISQLHFSVEPSTSSHSAGGHLRPPELQWAWVLLSVSISSNSHLFGSRTLVLSTYLKGEHDSGETEVVVNIHIINVQCEIHESSVNFNKSLFKIAHNIFEILKIWGSTSLGGN